jgi:hypothetical protein
MLHVNTQAHLQLALATLPSQLLTVTTHVRNVAPSVAAPAAAVVLPSYDKSYMPNNRQCAAVMALAAPRAPLQARPHLSCMAGPPKYVCNEFQTHIKSLH